LWSFFFVHPRVVCNDVCSAAFLAENPVRGVQDDLFHRRVVDLLVGMFFEWFEGLHIRIPTVDLPRPEFGRAAETGDFHPSWGELDEPRVLKVPCR
jgi:hypothetical protein